MFKYLYTGILIFNLSSYLVFVPLSSNISEKMIKDDEETKEENYSIVKKNDDSISIIVSNQPKEKRKVDFEIIERTIIQLEKKKKIESTGEATELGKIMGILSGRSLFGNQDYNV